jgi:hypothetical protein
LELALHTVYEDSVHPHLKRASFGILLRLVLAGVAFAMIWLDIAVYKTEILETSFTEITQEVFLFACGLLFWLSPGAPEQRGFKILVGGFFACLLMRELDGLFDRISHSAWCWPFSMIAIVSCVLAFKTNNRADTVNALAKFAGTPMFGTMATGLGVLVFSRVFGMGDLWHLILKDGYARLAKTAVEEGIELISYSMWLAASVEFFWLQRKTNAHAGASSKDLEIPRHAAKSV